MRLPVVAALVPAALFAQCDILPPTLVSPESAGLKPGPIAELVNAARASGTTGFAVLKDGKLIAAFNEHKPLNVYSISKAVTSLAAGRLFTEGRWANVDAPLSSLLPGFDTDPKGAVTLRQLMSHTSGIRDARDPNGRVTREWNTARDRLALARTLPIDTPPGTAFKYNNQGPFLVAAAVERTAAEGLHPFLLRTLFEPMCIAKSSWLTDRTGRAAGYAGLTISAFDLAKLGQLLLNRGLWGSRRLLSEDWIRQSALTSSQSVNKQVGLLWFLHWDPELPLPLPLIVHHSGDGGQYLYVFPNHNIVVARLRDAGEASPSQAMEDLPKRIIDALIRQQR
jgi:CubicO group peptidase (beta-lactamase class C family)